MFREKTMQGVLRFICSLLIVSIIASGCASPETIEPGDNVTEAPKTTETTEPLESDEEEDIIRIDVKTSVAGWIPVNVDDVSETIGSLVTADTPIARDIVARAIRAALLAELELEVEHTRPLDGPDRYSARVALGFPLLLELSVLGQKEYWVKVGYDFTIEDGQVTDADIDASSFEMTETGQMSSAAPVSTPIPESTPASKPAQVEGPGQASPFVSTPPVLVTTPPWPMFHGDLRHTGVSPYDTSHIDGTEKWNFETGDGIESSPAIGIDGTIYFGSHDGYLYAVNPDGTEKWRFDAGPPHYDERWKVSKSIMASPAIASDGTIYIYSSANYLFAIDPDGTEEWRFFVKWHNDFWSSPSVGPDGTIYIGSARSQEDPDYDGGLHAINPDGTEKWFFLDDSGVTSSAAIGADGTVYFGGNEMNPHGEGNVGKLYALGSDGTKQWEFTTENWMESSPAIGPDGTIYIGSGRESMVYAINPDGTEKWRFQVEVGVSAVPAIGADGTIYIGAWDCNFYALNPDGTEKWRFKTPEAFEGVSSSAAIGADGTIYVGSNSGNFYAFDPDGTVKWSFETSGSGIVASPAIGADGTVYFGSWNHKLYAIR
jgi:outer membrane protein assembly factor BamB